MEGGCWNISQVAHYLGVTEAAARKQLSRWSMRGEVHYPAQEVIVRDYLRPGQGTRTDRKKGNGKMMTDIPIHSVRKFEIARRMFGLEPSLTREEMENIFNLKGYIRALVAKENGCSNPEIPTLSYYSCENRVETCSIGVNSSGFFFVRRRFDLDHKNVLDIALLLLEDCPSDNEPWTWLITPNTAQEAVNRVIEHGGDPVSTYESAKKLDLPVTPRERE